MSISLSSCLSSQLDQNNILSDRQSYLNDSLIGQVHDFSKDINQMENMITSMEEMSKDIRLHLLDLQTIPGVTNACSHLQQHTQHFESIVENQIKSSLQRLSPVIMQKNLGSEIKPYSAPEWRHQTSSRELHPTFTGENSKERHDFEFCTPPREIENRKQTQATNGMCRRRLQYESDLEGKVGFGTINSFTKEDHSFTNQNAAANELDGSHFTACLDQGLKKSSPKEKSSDASVQKHSQVPTSTAPEPLENKKATGTELTSKSEEKSEEASTLADSTTNVNLKDLVSQAAKLLDNNDTDLGIDTDSMVDSMLSEIREAFNQNVKKVFKDVDTSDLLSKQPQETNSNKMTSAKKNFLNVSDIDIDDSDHLLSEEKPEEYDMSEAHDNTNNEDHDYYYYYPPPFPPPPFSACVDTDCNSSTWEPHEIKQAWAEGKEENLLWCNNRRKKKKGEEVEGEVEEVEEEGVDEDFCPFISGGVRPHKGSKLDQLQTKKNSTHDREKKYHHNQKNKGNNFDEYGDSHFFLSDMTNLNSTTAEKTPGPCCNKVHSKHKRCVQKKSQIDKKSRGVHFSDTVRLIEDNDGDVIESEILMPQEKLDCQYRSPYRNHFSNRGYLDVKTHKKHSKKFANNQISVGTQRNDVDLSQESVSANQDRNTHDKCVMTALGAPKTNPAGSSISAWTKECWSDPSSPRTRTENWKCNSRIEDEQNGIFKSFTIESISTDKTLPSISTEKTSPLNQWTNGAQQNQEETYAKRLGNDYNKKDNSKRNGVSEYSIAGGCGPGWWENPRKGKLPNWQVFDDSQNNPTSPRNSSESQMAFVCCILPQNICNSTNKNINASENVYISNMMLNELKGEDLKNPQKIGQPIEASEAKKVSYLVRELMEHLHANENISKKDYHPDRGMALGTGSSPAGRRMSWVDAVNPGKSSSPCLSQSGSPILFCYLPPEFLPQAHQVKSMKKPSKESRKATDISSPRDKITKKSSLHKGCQTEANNKMFNNINRMNDNPAGISWWISAPPRVKKKPTSRIQQIYTNKLPPPVPLVTVKSVGKESRMNTSERKVKTSQSPYNKKPKLGLNSSPTKKKPFLI